MPGAGLSLKTEREGKGLERTLNGTLACHHLINLSRKNKENAMLIRKV